MEIQNLPMFKELSRVFCSYNIESWQTVDFWDKVKLLKVVDSNVNYQSIYRLILRLVKDGYLKVDVEKSRHGQTTYTETENLHDLRSQFCFESKSTLQVLNLKKEELESEIIALEEEIDALEDLKKQFPDIQFRIEQLKQVKFKDIYQIKIKIKALKAVVDYLVIY
ncbi:PadR family transcriptional regulator [Acinetobacter bereziniae]|uniref:PadR family transcriptional regulator n=1 Tax=Acinetobacter bereziniae TaxID=106648 RepID=UPI0019001453|nr:PadR family transcriptional regulator [Acinetobacter bereziniae]MBJ8453543.1 PadR family transcriptional regulator [Acinetobacter bereziniae]MBJ8458581.1 PadR family transcriptional regulator [Acinetobacter bereziniae]